MAEQNPATSDDRIREQLRKWRDELINLSRVNRLLYFRHTKTSTMEIESPPMRDVVEHLERSGLWSFYMPESGGDDSQGEEREPTDGELVTNKADTKSVTTALRSLERRASQEFMDKGLWILYLAAGMLVWTDEDGSQAESPLLLLPVTVQRSTPQEPFHLRRTEDDPVVNPALTVKLEKEFGIELPTLDPQEDLDVEDFCRSVTQRIGSQTTWRVVPRLVLAPFSFFKEAMYRDLLDNEQTVFDHDTICAMVNDFEHADSGGTDGFEPTAEDKLDEVVRPEEMASILDADASQRQCIAAAVDGHTFVMDGPPGTGKSQTIANIIAELLYGGKTILFVSEKAAALEVVQSRLVEAGLGQYVLELHSHKATRKEVAKALGETLHNQPKAGPAIDEADVTKLLRRRRELSAYAVAVNETRPPLGRSVHAVIGRIAELEGEATPQAPLPASVESNLDADSFARLCDVAAQLGRSWGPVTRGDDFLWRDLAEPTSTVGRLAEIKALLDQALPALARLINLATAASQEMGLPVDPSMTGASALVDLLAHLAVAPPNVQVEWLVADDLGTRIELATSLKALASAYAAHRSALAQVSTEWLNLDAGAAKRLDDADASLREALPGISLPDTATAEWIDSMIAFLSASSAMAKDRYSSALVLAGVLGLGDDFPSLDRAIQIAQLALLAGAPNRPESGWFDPVQRGTLHAAADVLSKLVMDYKQRRAELTDVFADEVLALDLEGLVQRFTHVHSGAGKLSSSYRQDKRTLGAVTRAGKVTKDCIDRLPDALAWQRLSKELDQAEELYAEQLGGHYYRGIDTDVTSLIAAIEVADQALRLAGEHCDPHRLAMALSLEGTLDSKLFLSAQEMVDQLASWRKDAVALLGEPTINQSLERLSIALDAGAHQFEVLGSGVRDVIRVCDRQLPVAEARLALFARAAADRIDTQVRILTPFD